MKVDLAYLEKLSKLETSSDKKAEAQENFDKILNFIDSITKLELPEEDNPVVVPQSQKLEELFSSNINLITLVMSTF